MGSIDYGIDLGTTNSSIALCRGGQVKVFQTTELMNVTPSVVHVGKTGRVLVGRRAYDTWVADPQNTQAEFKRWMGLSDRLEFPASGKSFSAAELSAEVLKALRGDVMRANQDDVTAAVITVASVWFSDTSAGVILAAWCQTSRQMPVFAGTSHWGVNLRFPAAWGRCCCSL